LTIWGHHASEALYRCLFLLLLFLIRFCRYGLELLWRILVDISRLRRITLLHEKFSFGISNRLFVSHWKICLFLVKFLLFRLCFLLKIIFWVFRFLLKISWLDYPRSNRSSWYCFCTKRCFKHLTKWAKVCTFCLSCRNLLGRWRRLNILNLFWRLLLLEKWWIRGRNRFWGL